MHLSTSSTRAAYCLVVGASLLCRGNAHAQAADATSQVSSEGTEPAHYTIEEIDRKTGLRGWNVPYFSVGNTLTGDKDGWRSRLADKGIGFLAESIPSAAYNVLDVPRSNPAGQQAYWGQRVSAMQTANIFFTYDLSKHVPDGQLQIAADITNSSWEPYTPTSYQLYRLAYYQSMFNRRMEFSVGYMSNALTFVGVYVGGQLQNPFGPSSSIPVQLGLSGSTAIAPTAWVKFNARNGAYNQFGVQRSISPTGPAIYTDHLDNPNQFKFRTDGTRLLYIDEVGYKQAAVGDRRYTWLRGGVIYNTTPYHNYKTGGTSDNFGAYALADRQLMQFDSDGGRRGLYAGVSAMYAKPETNTITQYYEARLYSFGPFSARPRDMVSLVYQHNVISDHFGDFVDATAATTGVTPNSALNSLTGSYEFKLVPGFSITTGLGYTDNPTATKYQKEGSALNVLLSLFIAL